MNRKINGSHQDDSLGGRSKRSQVPSVPSDVVMRTDADVTRWLRGVEKANAATNSSVSGISELTPHSQKHDLPPSAPGPSTRVSRDSDGEISKPFSHVKHNKPEKDVFAGDYPGRAPVRRVQVEDVKERDPEKLRQTKRRQFTDGNTN